MGALAGCGDDTSSNPAPPSAEALGGFSLDCGTSAAGAQQAKQVPFQQQQSCVSQNPQAQKFTFKNSKVANFNVQLDCANNRVVVQGTGGDTDSQTLPILSDGSVDGQLTFQQQVASDGLGGTNCWVQYVVNVTGQTSCNPTPAPSATPGATSAQQSSLQLTTTVSFEPTTADQLRAAGIDTSTGSQPGEAAPSPSPSPSASASPSPSPSPSPSVTPSPSPTPSSTVTPGPTPSASVTPSLVCQVQDPCPIESKADLSCSQ
jgi:hypothetical protein